jgi:hypothetical protein
MATTRFTDGKDKTQIEELFTQVAKDLTPINTKDPDTFVQLDNRSIKVGKALIELTTKSVVGYEVVNSWLENQEIFAKTKGL